MNYLTPTNTTSVKILAADDNPANLRLLSEFLKNLNADVTTATNGIEVLAAMEKQVFDLIFMDIRMPDMDGKEATRKIRELEGPDHRVPIIALSAGRIEEQKIELLLTGMDDFLDKPVNHGKLEEVIHRWTHREVQNTNHYNENSDTDTDDEAIFSAVESLRLVQGKTDLALDMFTTLVNSLDKTLVEINQSRQQNDREALHDAVHKLHGGCCYCGVPSLKAITSSLDDQLQQRNEHNLEANLNVLIERIQELQNWVKNRDMHKIFTP